MVCLPSNPINEIYDILTPIVRSTKPLAGESAPTCVCHGSTGKVPVLQPQCSPPELCLSPHAPPVPCEPLGQGSGLSTSCSSFLCAGACPPRRKGFFAVLIFQKGAKSNQPVPWKRAGGASAVSQQRPELGRMERWTMAPLCCSSPG